MHNIKNIKDVETIIRQIETTENAQRKNDCFSDYRVLMGDQRPLLEASLQREFPDSWQEMRIMEYNFMRKIVNKRSKIYKDGVLRHIVVDGKSTEEQKVFDAVYKYMDANKVLKKANSFYEGFSYTLLQIYITPEGYLQLRALPPYLYDIIADVTGKERVVVLSHYTSSGILKPESTDFLPDEKQYTLWSDTDFVVVSRIKDEKTGALRLEYKQVDGNEEGINPFGVLPFVFALKRETDGFYYPMRNSMAQQCLDINKTLSDVMSIARNQGFGQAVMTASEEVMPENVKVGFKSLIKIPIPAGGVAGTFEYVTSNAPISEQMAAIAENIGFYLSVNDLESSEVSGSVDGANALNGISRLIESAKLNYSIDEAKSAFKQAEQELLEIILKALNLLKSKNALPKEYQGYREKNYELFLEFLDPAPIQGEEDKLMSIERKLDLGLIEDWEKHRIMNSEISEDEAREKESKIKGQKLSTIAGEASFAE